MVKAREEGPSWALFLFLFKEGLMKQLYSYDGPVTEFDRVVCSRWKATTYATSENKARSNLAYRFKKENNRVASAKVTLPGKITPVQ